MKNTLPLAVRVAPVMNRKRVVEEGPPGGGGGAKAQSLEGLLEFEPEEEKLWWEGADLVEAAAQVIEAPKAPELTRWQRATNVASDALDKAKKWIDSKLYQLWQAIEDYFDYHEEE